MSSLFAFLVAAVTPIAKRLLVGLGFGFMTYTGVSVAFGAMVNSMRNTFTMLPPDVLIYAQMSGILESMGLILAALSFKISMGVFSKLQKMA